MVSHGSKGGFGIGSASLLLIFAVLCMVIFSLSSYLVTSRDRSLVDVELAFLEGWYRADTQGQLVLAELLSHPLDPSQPKQLPLEVLGTAISYIIQDEVIKLSFYLEVTELNILVVQAVVYSTHYDLLLWRLEASTTWSATASPDVWQGP